MSPKFPSHKKKSTKTSFKLQEIPDKMKSKTVKDRPFVILGSYNNIVCAQQIETSSTLMVVNVPPGSIHHNQTTLSFNARISNGLSVRCNS